MKPILFCDIDHTVSNAAWRDPMIGCTSWDEYHAASVHDKPIWPMITLLRALDKSGWIILGLTARPAKWRRISMDWMLRYQVPMMDILMRADENFRPSPEMKTALVKARFAQELNSEAVQSMFVFDDRDDVVAAFKELGVTALQVHARLT